MIQPSLKLPARHDWNAGKAWQRTSSPRVFRQFLSALALLLFAELSQPQPAITGEMTLATWEAQAIQPDSLSGMQSFFQALGYDWRRLETGVPPFILERIPEDMDHSANVTAKKHAFFMGLLPMVLLANQEIERERRDLLAILDRDRFDEELSQSDQARLDEMLARYDLRGNPLTDHRIRATLLRRIDTIPPALVLAQAANESAWGTSRFARQGNNLFGEWTFKPGTGIVPADRPDGATYEVRKFTNIYDSIRSYMRNLNTHDAYLKLREIRNTLRREDKPVTGLALAPGLLNYSQRGEDYVADIQGMIRHNRLADINRAFLRNDEGSRMTEPSGAGLFSSRYYLSRSASTPLSNP